MPQLCIPVVIYILRMQMAMVMAIAAFPQVQQPHVHMVSTDGDCDDSDGLINPDATEMLTAWTTIALDKMVRCN